MKTIGLIGGMSFESTAEYYRIINEETAARLGGLHSADILMRSIDFAPMEKLQRQGKWDEIALQVSDIAADLEKAGADFILLCTNTTHHVAERVQSSIRVPLLHIAEAAADAVKKKRLKRVGLLGTLYISRFPFYREHLERRGLSVLFPEKKSMEFINRVIYDELCRGVLREKSKREILGIIGSLVKKGAQGIILGCTELPLLIKDGDAPVPVFDTLRIHAQAAVAMAI